MDLLPKCSIYVLGKLQDASPFWTRSWAAVTFFFLPPVPSAFSAFCCSFFCRTPVSISTGTPIPRAGDLPWTRSLTCWATVRSKPLRLLAGKC